jgi:hypothetical protein
MRVGIWDYVSGTSGSVDMAAHINEALDVPGSDEARVLSITAIAGASDATIAIDNRGTVTVPAGQALVLNPNGTIINPTIVFTDTSSFVIEFVTNNWHGYTRGNI